VGREGEEFVVWAEVMGAVGWGIFTVSLHGENVGDVGSGFLIWFGVYWVTSLRWRLFLHTPVLALKIANGRGCSLLGQRYGNSDVYLGSPRSNGFDHKRGQKDPEKEIMCFVVPQHTLLSSSATWRKQTLPPAILSFRVLLSKRPTITQGKSYPGHPGAPPCHSRRRINAVRRPTE
jgi:hypothetical protein